MITSNEPYSYAQKSTEEIPINYKKTKQKTPKQTNIELKKVSKWNLHTHSGHTKVKLENSSENTEMFYKGHFRPKKYLIPEATCVYLKK